MKKVCSEDYGFVLRLNKIDKIGMGTIDGQYGYVVYPVDFTITAFKPNIEDIVIARVTAVSKCGFFAQLGPLEIFVPHTHIPEGYDFLKVHETFAGIVTQVQRTRLPYFVEVQTFRYMEHVGVGDDYRQGIRSRDELETWQARDPLMIRKDLVAKYSPAVLAEIDEAVRYAEASPWPGRDELLKDVI